MKKISRRAFLSVMAAAGAAAALTACGGSSGSSTAASGSASVGGSQPGGHKLTAYAWDKNFNIHALNAAAADYKENVDPEFELEVIEQSGAGDVENAITLAGSATIIPIFPTSCSSRITTSSVMFPIIRTPSFLWKVPMLTGMVSERKSCPTPSWTVFTTVCLWITALLSLHTAPICWSRSVRLSMT